MSVLVNLLAAPGVDPDVWAAVCVVFVLVSGIGAGVAISERKKRMRAEVLLRAERSKPAQQFLVQSKVDGEREDQQKRMADLHIAKLRVELDILNRQAAMRDSDTDRLEASKEYHELMVEKTRLEIEGLRLHVAEQRKRLDDWTGGPE